MLTYFELKDLKERLNNGSVTIKYAKELFWNDFKEGSRSWHTKDWEERRARVIKDKCEICSSKETLTIQHRSHPQKYYEHESAVAKLHTQLLIDSNSNIDRYEFEEYILNKYTYEPIPLCPNCKSRKPNERMRKTPKFLCTICQHEFGEPFFKSVKDLIATFYENEDLLEVRDKCFVSKDKWRNQHNFSNIRYWLQRDRAKKQNVEVIEKEAFLNYLDDTIKYLSFEDAITACKKCAYNFDIKRLELCPKCKVYYKGIPYSSCIQCLPPEKRILALRKIEFGKEFQSIERDLGID